MTGLCNYRNTRYYESPALKSQPVDAGDVYWSFGHSQKSQIRALKTFSILKAGTVKTLSVCTDSWEIMHGVG